MHPSLKRSRANAKGQIIGNLLAIRVSTQLFWVKYDKNPFLQLAKYEKVLIKR